MAKCVDCGKTPEETPFYFRSDGRPQSRCIEHQNAYTRRHYQANKATYIAKARRSDQRRREKINALKERPCADCGVQYPPWVMEFDHLRDKAFTIGGSVRGFQAVLREAAKCEVVCANCHRQRTHDRSALCSSVDESA